MAEKLASVSYLGRCCDIFELDPLDIAGSMKLPPAIRPATETEEYGGYEVPAGVNFNRVSRSTVLTTEGLIYNSSDFTREISNALNLNAGFEGIGSFGASKSVRTVVNETQSRRYVFKYVIAVVQSFKVELQDDLTGFSPAAEFAGEVKKLPTEPGQKYRDFIKKFGTHFTSRLYLGGMAFQSVRTDTTTYLKSDQTQKTFEANASLELQAFKAGSNYKEESSEIHKRDNETSLSRSSITIVGATGGTALPDQWFEQVKTEPIPLPDQAVLKKLSELFTPELFPDDSAISAKRRLLEDEVKRYSNERGGQLGEELRYGDKVRLRVQGPGSTLLLRVNPKYPTRPYYLIDQGRISNDPEATLVLHDPANPGRTGDLVYTGRDPNQASKVSFWIEEANAYISMDEPQRQKIALYQMVADERVSKDPKQPRSQWITRCISGSMARASSAPRQAVVSGDELTICRWDEPVRSFFQLGTHGREGNRLFISSSANDPMYAKPDDPVPSNFLTHKFVLSKLNRV
jgi:hypothetical protein